MSELDTRQEAATNGAQDLARSGRTWYQRRPPFLQVCIGLLVPIILVGPFCWALNLAIYSGTTHHLATYDAPTTVIGREYKAKLMTFDFGVLSDFDARVVLSTPGGMIGDAEETVFIVGVDPTTVTVRWDAVNHLTLSIRVADGAAYPKRCHNGAT